MLLSSKALQIAKLPLKQKKYPDLRNDMSLISVHGDNIILYRNGKLLLKNIAEKALDEVDAPSSVIFMSGNYLVDSEKNLFVLEDSKMKGPIKLKRKIFCILEHGRMIYVADKFGDVYCIQGNSYEYVLGTLSYLTGMVIYNKNILLSDKYGRIRISTLDGRIVDYRYCPEPIVSLVCVGSSLVSVGNREVTLYDDEYVRSNVFELPEDVEVVKAISNGEDKLIVICSGSHFLFRIGDRIELLSCAKEHIVDGVCNASKLYKLMADGTVVDDSSGEVFM